MLRFAAIAVEVKNKKFAKSSKMTFLTIQKLFGTFTQLKILLVNSEKVPWV